MIKWREGKTTHNWVFIFNYNLGEERGVHRCLWDETEEADEASKGGGLKFWVLFLLTVTVALVDKFDFDSGSKVDLDKNKWLFF